MNLGTENKKKTIWAAVLGVVALALVVFKLVPFFAGSDSPSSVVAQPNNTSIQAPNTAIPGTRRHQTGPARNSIINSLDPTVRLDLLEAAENQHYKGSGRNIFEAYIPPPPTPKVEPKNPPFVPAQTQVQPPPPPINLKFYGWASKPGEPKRVFLSQGDEVFIAGEGQLVANRYKVIHISDTAVRIEDILNNNTQDVPIT